MAEKAERGLSMTEQEEFEFRRRFEAERGAKPKEDLAAKAARSGMSMRDGKVNWGVELEKQKIDEMSLPERVFKGLGAGFADIPLALRQIFTTDESKTKQLKNEAADKREVDKYLSKSTDLGVLPDQIYGVDTPTLGSTAQFYGKTAPTTLLPAARLAGLKGFASNVGTGTLLGALDPTVEGESRAWNMATSGAYSGVLPAATSAVKGVYNAVTRGGGQNRAGNELAKVLADGGDEQAVLRQTIDRLRNTKQGNIPLSTAAQLKDAQLARLEQGSRARNGANWYDFDQNQARAVAGAFDDATAEAADLAARRTTRGGNWDANWAAAQAGADAAKFAKDLPQFRANLDVALRSPEASNPATRGMLEAIAADIDRVTSQGIAYTPAHLQQIRANLSAKWHPKNDTAFTKADRSSPARLSVMQEVDNILNNTTGGKWADVVGGYAADSKLVEASKAAGRARNQFYDPQTGRVLGVSADPSGDIPKITEAALGRSINAGKGQFSTDAETRLAAILEALRAQGIVQGVKRSATAGGGSDTVSNQYAAKAAGQVADALGASGSMTAAAAKTGLEKLSALATANKDRALAEALQNPQQMIAVLERKLKAGAPLNAQEQYLLSMLRAAPAAATSN